ncbi:MAG: hypothetical protein ACRCZB_05040 [Bacteroidales bacterium]
MTTYLDEFEKSKNNRSNSMLSLRSMRKMEVDTEDRKQSLLRILFRADDESGIMDLMQCYYKLVRMSSGKNTLSPDFSSDYKAQYISNFELSVKGSGDGEEGLYPPTPEQPEKAVDVFNKNSKWVSTFGLEETATYIGVVPQSEILFSEIGTVAIRNSDRRGPYSTLDLAEKASIEDRGTGFLSLRTENSEVYKESTSYYIGKNGIDTPDNYSFKEQLIDMLDEHLQKLVDYKDSIILAIDFLERSSKTLKEFLVPMPNDKANLEIILDKIKTETLEYTEYKEYFLGIEATEETRDEINQKLEDLKLKLSESIASFSKYSEDHISILGDSKNGAKKSLVFWVNEIVKKPDGCFSTLEGLSTIKPNAEIKLKEANGALKEFSSNTNEWLIKTEITGTFVQATLNLDKSIKHWSLFLTWKGILPSNKYKIYKKPFSFFNGEITNKEWDIPEFSEVVTLTEVGFLATQLEMPPPKESMIFRIRPCDEDTNVELQRIDEFNSYSNQSDIISEEIDFIQKDNIDDRTVLEISKQGFIRESDFVYLNNSILAQVSVVSENLIMLDSNHGKVETLKKLYGFYFFTEL